MWSDSASTSAAAFERGCNIARYFDSWRINIGENIPMGIK
jgi:hypothetical protein